MRLLGKTAYHLLIIDIGHLKCLAHHAFKPGLARSVYIKHLGVSELQFESQSRGKLFVIDLYDTSISIYQVSDHLQIM